MLDPIKQELERFLSQRGDDTAVIAVFSSKPEPPGMVLKIGFGAFPLDELTGEQEHKQVVQCCNEVGGDMPSVCIFRWPFGTPDTSIRWDITAELDAITKIACEGKPFILARFCWGDLGGVVDEQFVQLVAPRLARAHEQAEVEWKQFRPTSFLVSVRQDQEEIEWGATFTVTPDRLLPMADDDYLWEAIENTAAQHKEKYGTLPKAIARVTFSKNVTIREMSKQMSKVIRNLAQWSDPYEDSQVCFWLFD